MSFREIKFRIWDKELKKWWCEDSQYLQMDGEKIHPAPWSSLSADLPDETIVIQQFIGLKDKNGVDIYEGDILKETHYEYTGRFTDLVRHPDKMVGYDYRGVVYWTEGCPCNTKDSTDAYALLGFRTFPLDTTVGQAIGNSITRNCEVLGNMYENPELMVHGPNGPKYAES